MHCALDFKHMAPPGTIQILWVWSQLFYGWCLYLSPCYVHTFYTTSLSLFPCLHTQFPFCWCMNKPKTVKQAVYRYYERKVSPPTPIHRLRPWFTQCDIPRDKSFEPRWRHGTEPSEMRPVSLKGQGEIPCCLLLSLQQEGSKQTRTWILTRSRTASTSVMVFPASRTTDNKLQLFKSPSLTLLCSSGLGPFHTHWVVGQWPVAVCTLPASSSISSNLCLCRAVVVAFFHEVPLVNKNFHVLLLI